MYDVTADIEKAVTDNGGQFISFDTDAFSIVFDPRIIRPAFFYELLETRLPYAYVTKEVRTDPNGLLEIYVTLIDDDDSDCYDEDDEGFDDDSDDGTDDYEDEDEDE